MYVHMYILVSYASPKCLVQCSVGLYLIPLTACQHSTFVAMLIVVLSFQFHLSVCVYMIRHSLTNYLHNISKVKVTLFLTDTKTITHVYE